MVMRSAAPTPPKWSGKPPPGEVDWESLWCGYESPPPLVWGLVGANPPPSSPPLWVWGLVGVNPPPSSCGVGFGGVEFVLGSLGEGRIHGPSSVGSPRGGEASLLSQTIFCGRRFCSETLGYLFRCFCRLWRFLLGAIQYRAIKSVLMTSRPRIIDYALCHIRCTIYSRICTIYYRLYSVYMVYLKR